MGTFEDYGRSRQNRQSGGAVSEGAEIDQALAEIRGLMGFRPEERIPPVPGSAAAERAVDVPGKSRARKAVELVGSFALAGGVAAALYFSPKPSGPVSAEELLDRDPTECEGKLTDMRATGRLNNGDAYLHPQDTPWSEFGGSNNGLREIVNEFELAADGVVRVCITPANNSSDMVPWIVPNEGDRLQLRTFIADQ